MQSLIKRSGVTLKFVLLGCLVPALLSTTTARASYVSTVLADNPVGYWRLDEANGATTADNLGTAGALLDASYYAGGKTSVAGLISSDPTNTAANFTPDQAVTGSGLDSVAGGNPFANSWTIEAWLIRDSTQYWPGIFSNVENNLGSPLLGFIEAKNSIGINGAGVSPNNVSVPLGGSQFGQRIYAVVTKTGGNADGTANLSVYVNLNGTWLTTATGTNSGWPLATSNGFSLGRHYGGGNYFDGIIDEVAIYNYALTPAQIEQHYLAAPEPSSICMLLFGGALMFKLFPLRRHSR